jgi:hypothetical protein
MRGGETVSMAMPWDRTIYLSKGHGVETSYEKQVLALRYWRRTNKGPIQTVYPLLSFTAFLC